MSGFNSGKFMNHIEHNWAEVFKNFRDGLVFLDDSTAEALHWNGGLKRAFDSGAVSIESFTPFVVIFPFLKIKISVVGQIIQQV